MTKPCISWHLQNDFVIQSLGKMPVGAGAGVGWDRHTMTMRTIAFLLLGGLMLGGCMQETLEPSTQASWKPRDKELMSNLPYAQASIPDQFKRHIVSFDRQEA